MSPFAGEVPFATASEVFVRASVLVVIAHGAFYLTRRRSAALRELIARCFLLTLCLLPILTLSGLSLDVLPALGERREGALEFVAWPGGDLEMAIGADGRGASAGDAVWNWRALLLALWLVGTLSLALRALRGHVRAKRELFGPAARPLPEALRQSLGLPDETLAVLSSATEQPVVAGIFRPRVALPLSSLSWSQDRQLAVLAHERAHVARFDPAGLLLRQLAVALWWPQPLVALLGRRLSLLCEQACDDRVLEGGASEVSYAQTLVEIARDFRAAQTIQAPVLPMHTSHQLGLRVQSLLRRDQQRARPRLLTCCASVSIVLTLALLCGTGRAEAQGEKAPVPPKKAAARKKRTPLHFVVTADNKILYAARQIGLDDLKAVVERKARGKRRPSVVVMTHRRAKASVLVKVIDRLKVCGVRDISFAAPLATPQLDLGALEKSIASGVEPVQALEAGDKAPRIVQRIAPRVTAALRAHTPAKVVLVCVVGPDGGVSDVRVDKSTDKRFDEAARATLSKWRFEPGMRGGKPARVLVRIPIVFVQSLTAQQARKAQPAQPPRLAREKRREAKAVRLGSIRGRVRDADFEGPLGGALVKIVETRVKVVASKDGSFNFDRVPVGVLTLVVSKKGYATKKLRVKSIAGNVMQVTVGLNGRFEPVDDVRVKRRK